MKIFITGGTGFLGNQLSKQLKKNKKNIIIIGSKKRKSKVNLDLTLKKNLKKIIELNPDIIINCAGLTSVDKCEKNKKLAFKTNALITKNLVSISKNLDCKLIQISTDHVYNGVKKNNVENKCNLKNYYSTTKRLAELEALKYYKSLILRTNFFGISKKNKGNLNWFFEKIKKKQTINLFSDVYFSPLYINTLCQIISKICNKNTYGIFNVGSINKISKKNFYLMISKNLGLKILFKPVKLDNEIRKAKITKRPKNMSMNVDKFQKNLKIKLPTIRKEIQKFTDEYKNK
tara:strand:- start:286 stop:1152 length:867 start_codon:yes stop_codon:yes gene_type:complete